MTRDEGSRPPLDTRPKPGSEVGLALFASLAERLESDSAARRPVLARCGLTLDQLQRPTSRVSWETACQIFEGTEAHYGASAPEQLGEELARSPSLAPMRQVARDAGVLGLAELLTESNRHMVVRCIAQKLVRTGNRSLRIDVTMEAGYLPSDGFARARLGFLRALPAAAGLSPVAVSLESDAHGADHCYTITWQREQPRAWLRRRLWPERLMAASMRGAIDALRGSELRERSQAATLTRAETELRERDELFARAFQSAPVAMAVSDPETGLILLVNDRFVDLSGYAREEILGRRATEIGIWPTPEHRDRLREVMAEGGGRFEGAEAVARTRSGQERLMLLSAESIHLEGKGVVLWQAVDITERKRLEQTLARERAELEERVARRTEELARSRDRLKESERLASLGTLAAGIAHQINNPIGAVLAATQYALLCEGDDDDRDTWRRSLAEIEEQAKRCGQIVRNLLQFARNEPGERWREPLAEIVQRCVRLCRAYAAERGGELLLEEPAAPYPVKVSPIEIDQALINLIRNALESHAGARVRVRARQQGDRVVVEVEDDGPGIPESLRQRVFEPFFSTRVAQGGSGLGLSVAHGVVTAHGGEIWIPPTRSAGTTICISLPLLPP